MKRKQTSRREGSKWPTEVKMADGWHFNTGAFQEDDVVGPKPVWSREGYPTRDAARAAKRGPSQHSMDRQSAQTEKNHVEQEAAQKVVDTASSVEVDSPQSPIPASVEQPISQEKTMTLTLKTLSKNGKQAYYSGAAQIARFPLGIFPGKTAPQTIEVADGVFAVAAVKVPKVKLTKEERAALPKPTFAELIERRRKSLAALEAKEAAASL